MFDYVGMGNRLLSVRLNRGMKQHELGKALGLTQASYSDIETGKREVSLNQIFTLAEALNVNVGWLIGLDLHGGLSESESLKLEEYKRLLINSRNKD